MLHILETIPIESQMLKQQTFDAGLGQSLGKWMRLNNNKN